MGNGSSIKIWSDSWLPGNGNGKVLTPVVDSMRVITVDLFIDSHHRQWKGSIIGSLLDPHDAEKIKTFPLAGLLLVILYFGHLLRMEIILVSLDIVFSVNIRIFRYS